ncbi:MAG: hypothetical protein ACR2LL_08165, partial [Nitrosopumilus sp.]
MKVKQKQKVISTSKFFSKTGIFQDYKSCSFCGQNQFPFKKGVCPKCYNQVGDIQYVKDPKEYVKSNYGNVKMRIKEDYQ